MANTYDAEGSVLSVGAVQTFGSGFTKREVVIDTKDDGQKYDNPVRFTFKKDKCALLDGVNKGQRVKVRFAVDGRKWDGPKGTQYFVDLTGLGIESVGVSEDIGAVIDDSASDCDEPDCGDMPF